MVSGEGVHFHFRVDEYKPPPLVGMLGKTQTTAWPPLILRLDRLTSGVTFKINKKPTFRGYLSRASRHRGATIVVT